MNQLIELQDRLSELDVPQEESFELRRIQARLFDPSAVEWCENAIEKLKQKIETARYEYDPPLTDYKFDNFVVGESNKMVYRAAKMVAEEPGKRYNPLFIHGGVGLGKTHILNAVGNRILDKNPHARVAYLTSEKFTNELIEAISGNNVEDFRNKYRSLDVLMIDDIQFLAGRERTQEEFFHCFNALYTVHKGIIITSDRSPKELVTLEDRLRSRFEGGLVAEIKPPSLETRVQVVEKVLILENFEMDGELVKHIAGHVSKNIRELIGVVNRVVANCILNDLKPTEDIINNILKETVGEISEEKTTMSEWEVRILELLPQIERYWYTLDLQLHHEYLTDEYRVEKTLFESTS